MDWGSRTRVTFTEPSEGDWKLLLNRIYPLELKGLLGR